MRPVLSARHALDGRSHAPVRGRARLSGACIYLIVGALGLRPRPQRRPARPPLRPLVRATPREKVPPMESPPDRRDTSPRTRSAADRLGDMTWPIPAAHGRSSVAVLRRLRDSSCALRSAISRRSRATVRRSSTSSAARLRSAKPSRSGMKLGPGSRQIRLALGSHGGVALGPRLGSRAASLRAAARAAGA